MNKHEKYMQRCIDLAKKGLGNVAPNPLVGAVIVYNDTIIGEGYHRQFGKEHAEINAINSVKDKNLLKESTIYVTLEPCSHFGKTPPCADTIVQYGFKQVVIGNIDPFEKVAGKGIEKLKAGEIDVITSVMEKECWFINRRFMIAQTKKRPYLILKFAQSKDGFIDIAPEDKQQGRVHYISSAESLKLVHKWRSEEAAIMVGTNTVISDNPELTCRFYPGKSPVRITLDKNLRIPKNAKIKNDAAPTIIYNSVKSEKIKTTEYVQLNWHKQVLKDIFTDLHHRGIQSIIIEGGAQLLNYCIKENLWDEARIFTSLTELKNGVKAPNFPFKPIYSENVGSDILAFYYHPQLIIPD
ncbi:MAG: bifunctional diaminohydroxyphosphoribosylaminopyrimidine deaminase/5-amino-6-(5-phosphoribosylamino)uracil reductase RibD [Bacteroidia bacterium]